MVDKPKILFVDDDEGILDSYSLLRKNKFCIVTANDLVNALSMAKYDSFDALITDKNL